MRIALPGWGKWILRHPPFVGQPGIAREPGCVPSVRKPYPGQSDGEAGAMVLTAVSALRTENAAPYSTHHRRGRGDGRDD